MQFAMLNLKNVWPAAGRKACFDRKVFAVAKIFVNLALASVSFFGKVNRGRLKMVNVN